VKTAGVIAVVAVAVALQTAVARYAVGTEWQFDLVLVAIVYAALRWGPSAGVLAGTLGGLTQDALAGGVAGVGGLSGTIVGFAAGLLGRQFIITRPLPRMLLVAGATLAHRGVILVIRAAIDQRWPAVAWLSMLGEVALNACAAFIVYQGVETVPQLARRRPMRRSGFGARKW
jgi:rod shape-determining protein MreD